MRNLQVRTKHIQEISTENNGKNDTTHVQWAFCEQSNTLFYSLNNQIFRKSLDSSEDIELVAE